MCLVCERSKMSGFRAGGGGPDSWVRRFSVDETSRHPGGFTVYKITSVLFPLASPEAVSVVSVWKRYSDVCRLQRNMRTLHAALHLKGDVPAFKQSSYFRRFEEEVIAERRATTKKLLECIAEHRLLFTSAEFVNFLQSGYDAPTAETAVGVGSGGGGVIEAIRSALHLPSEDAPPLEYPSDDEAPAAPVVLTPVKLTEESRDSPEPSEPHAIEPETSRDDDTQLSISEIQVFEAVDVEFKSSPQKLNVSDSFESLSSWGSGNSNFYDELDQVDSFMDTSSTSKRVDTFMNTSSVSKKGYTVLDASTVSKRQNVLPDLISFPNEASTSRTFEDYHTMDKDTSNNNSAASMHNPSETTSVSSVGDSSLNEHSADWKRSTSRQTVQSAQSARGASRTEDSYVFEAGYMLSLGARCEDLGDYRRAFHCYKSGIEKMLLGVQSDTDQNRRSIIKEKTSKYLAYAESIYTNHLISHEPTEPERERERVREEEELGMALPARMLRQPPEELARYRVLCVPARGAACMSLLHKERQTCLAMKVIQKIPNNRTEFDDFFSQPADDTKSPVLPTNVPYMVRLRSYVETPDLIFLILDYAPGGKLMDYIANYVQSLPTTPAREVNLENVFIEPAKRKNSDIRDNISTILDKMEVEDRFNTETTKMDVEEAEDKLESQAKTDINDSDRSVNDLVINSQRLLLNVDSALSDTAGESVDVVDRERDSCVSERSAVNSLSRVRNTHVLEILKKEEAQRKQLRLAQSVPARDALPPATVRTWGAELLTALEHLHNAGVICRDLSADNLLLGERGQLLVTYRAGYREREVTLARLARDSLHREPSLYVAPELYDAVYSSGEPDTAHTCDWWSFGALMYELICRVLLTYSPAERLGAGGVHEIKSHPYFRSVDWQEVLRAWRPPD